MASNGQLSPSELAPIPGGQLAIEAAGSWNAPHGPAANGLRPTGSDSSYRTLDRQKYYWQLYQEGRGNLAAYPGTSNHGWGLAVDLAEPWMRSWVDEHGHEFCWAKTEAFSEWWHVNYTGGCHFPTFKTLRKGQRGPRVVKFTRRLAYIHPSGHSAYLGRSYTKFKEEVRVAVYKFQQDQGLSADGVIGPATARRINAVFHKQYQERKGRRHRTVRARVKDAVGRVREAGVIGR